MQLRLATVTDAHDIAVLHVETWRAAYAGIMPANYLDRLSVAPREEMWKSSLAGNSVGLVVAEESDRLAGFVAFGRCRDEGSPAEQGEIYALYVDAPYWSTGVGRALWLEARERMSSQGYRTVSLWVLAQNARGIRFYRAAGFQLDTTSSKTWDVAGISLREVRYVVSHG